MSLILQPSTAAGAVNYKGTWNATTNSPSLASGVGTQGDYYVVSTGGTTNLDGITDWATGDWAIFNGTTWQKVDNSDLVTSVNGSTGAVTVAPANAAVLTSTDVSGLSAEVNLGALTTGLLKHTVSGGVSTPATAVADTDYLLPATAASTYLTQAAAASTYLTQANAASTYAVIAAGFSWGVSIAGTSGTGVTETISNSASSGTIAHSIVFGNTQTQALKGLTVNMGTSDLDHQGIFVDFSGVSSSLAYGVYIDGGTTSKDGIPLRVRGRSSGSSYSLIEAFATNVAHAGPVIQANMNNGAYAYLMNGSDPRSVLYGYVGTGTGWLNFRGINLDINPLNNQENWKIANVTMTQSGSLTAKSGTCTTWSISRTNTATSGTVADNFKFFDIKRTNIQNGAGGTLTSAGSVLTLENVATQTAGTLTDTVSVLQLLQDVDSTGNLITGSGDSGTTTTFAVDKRGLITTTMGTGTGTQKMTGVANVNTTAVGNVGVGEDDLITYALAANSMSAAGKGVRITVWGTAANNANAKTLKLYFGTQIILTNSITTAQAGVWQIEAIVLSTGTDAQDWKAAFSNTGTVSTLDNEVGTATQDDGAAITIKCTGEATDNNDIVQEGMVVEFIN